MKNPFDALINHIAEWAYNQQTRRILASIEADRRRHAAEMAVTNGDDDA